MKNTKIILFFVLLLAFALRIVDLSDMPASANWDEISHGYNAYSILLTGEDEWGKAFPLANFRAYGDYPLTLNLYLTIPFIKIFGLSVFAIRLPHALLGTLLVLIVYFISQKLFNSKFISIVSALMIAISPWTFFTSRFVVQSNLAVFFFSLSLLLFLYRQQNKWFLPFSVFSLGLTLFSYHTTRIFSPLFLVAVIFLYKDKLTIGLSRVTKILSLVFLLLFFIPLGFILTRPEARARSNEVFLIDEGAISTIIEKRDQSPHDALDRFFYNRYTYFFKEAGKRYVGYFSPQFLFIKGGTQYQFSVQEHGVLYLVNLPFFYLGLFLIFRRSLKGKKYYQLLLAWLLLAPVPASITKESFAVIRSTTFLPLPMILTGLGLGETLNYLKKFGPQKRKKTIKILAIFAYLFLLGFFAENYLEKYFTVYKKDYSWAWQYGYEQAVDYAKDHYQDYDKIVVTKKYGEPHEFFLFYWPWNPAKYKNDPVLIRFYQSNWYWVDRFDKFYFVNDWEFVPEDTQSNFVFVLESGGKVNCQNTDCLVITSPENIPAGWKKLKTIRFLDGEAAFEIYEN